MYVDIYVSYSLPNGWIKLADALREHMNNPRGDYRPKNASETIS